MSYYEHDDAIRTLLRRARMLKIDDSGTQQKVDLGILASERPKDVVRLQPHGFTSNPPNEAEGLTLAMGGRSDRLLFLGGEHKENRPKGRPQGTATLYDDKGNEIFMRGAKGINMKAKKDHVVIWPEEDDKKVYLGGDPDNPAHRFALVVTTSGPSKNVWARIP